MGYVQLGSGIFGNDARKNAIFMKGCIFAPHRETNVWIRSRFMVSRSFWQKSAVLPYCLLRVPAADMDV